VLLYDSLWHPAKHAYNLEYIQKGLQCLELMVDAEPILNARTSIRRMIGAVEQAITSRPSDKNNNTSGEAPTTTTTPGQLAANTTTAQNASPSFPTLRGHNSTTPRTSPQAAPPQPPPANETTFTSAANDFLYLSDRAPSQPQNTTALQTQSQTQANSIPANNSVPNFDPNAAMLGGGDPMSFLDFDVLTTDLYNFFPIQTDKGVGDFGGR
jgi:hypothetical protein